MRRNRESIHQVAVLAMCMIYPHSPLAEQFEYYGIDPATLETFNPNTVVIEWKDVTGLDLAARQARFWELFRLIRGYGIDVVGVEDEEEMTPGLVSELVERLSSPTGWVREDAMVRLARAVEPGLVPVMVRAVSDESFLVAGQALVNLSRLDPDRAYELAAPMLSRVVSYVDLCAAIAVAKRTDDRTMDLLENRLNARLYTKHSTDLSLALAPHRKLYAAFEEFAAAAAGGQAEERSDGALQRLLGHESAWVRRRGLRWLLETRMDLAASKARDLDAAFADPDSGVRRLALELAHRARLSASPEALERLLADPDDSVRAWAAALSASPVARQARSLVAGGNWPPETASEFLKLLALRTSESPGTVEQLSKVFAPALSDGSPAIRLEALRELLAREDWRCLPEVLPALSDPDAQVRRRAAEYVGRAGDLSAQLSLLPLLSDPDLFVMQEATAALARMRSPLVWRHLGRFVLETTCGELPDFMAAPIQACVDAFKQVLAFEPLARAGDRTALRSIWESSGPMERAFLLALFQRTGTGEANFDLVKRSLSDSEAEVRVLGLAILEELGDPGAVPAVMALVQDPWFECRAGACRFLSRVRHGPARPALLHLLHDAHDHVKEWAARGLGRLGNPADAHVLEDLLGEANFARLPADAQADLEPLFRQLHRRGVQ
ncbi:MAG: HEAT repeat domain-containing protein [Candidatus Wallbacteria bacterium]|nr:HEAT repeat domain-containing protein [Candidatus Wallbacteria bacterium]